MNSQLNKIVFLGGVHGVGKTTFCDSLLKFCDYKHYSASQLIKKQKSCAISSDEKRVKDVGNNQVLLIQALKELKDHKILLDGHYTILNSQGDPEPVPYDVFESISPLALIVLYDDPEAIAERFNSRDNKTIEASEIDLHQDFELEYATRISNKLELPLISVKTSEPSLQEVLTLLSNL